jgi:Na+/melibiose symporter-like transporter
VAVFFLFSLAGLCAGQTTDQKVAALQEEVMKLRASGQAAAAGGMVSFLFGAFCALWAQNTGRNAWLWFFLGLIFSVITVIILLLKNSDDRNLRSGTGRKPG